MGKERIVISGPFFLQLFLKTAELSRESKHQAQKLIFITLAPLEDRAQKPDVLDKSRLDQQWQIGLSWAYPNPFNIPK